MTIKYFYPGPSYVAKDTLNAQVIESINHRGEEFRQLYKSTKDNLAKIMKTKNGRCFIVTSSATGAMEMSARNFVKDRVVCVSSGAFGDRWHKIVLANGKQSDLLTNGWGRTVKYDQIKTQLMSGKYDCLNIVHNETSTGFANELDLFKKINNDFPDIIISVDSVSSFGSYAIYPEEYGIDFLLAGSQKGLATPPGITVCYCSEKAINKASKVPNRGYYFDVIDFLKYDEKNETPQTPAITLINALNFQLNKIIKEGIEARFKRHNEMAKITQQWAKSKGFELYPEAGYESTTVTCIKSKQNIDTSKMILNLKQKGYVISNGYGELKNLTFRIGHMGDVTVNDLNELLAVINQLI